MPSDWLADASQSEIIMVDGAYGLAAVLSSIRTAKEDSRAPRKTRASC